MTVYENELDSWYSSCPGPVKSILSSPYEWVSSALHWVAGDPDKLAAQGPVYIAQGQQIQRYAQQVTRLRDSPTQWTGDARTSYNAKMDQLAHNFDTLGQAVSATDEILASAAQISIAAANMIIDAIKSLIEFLIATIIVNAALAVFTFGASLAAAIAEGIAETAATMAQIAAGLEKVAAVLMRIAAAMDKIATVMRSIEGALKTIKTILEALKELKSSVGLAGKVMLTGAGAAVKYPVNLAGNTVINGASSVTGVDLPNMPGGVTEAIHTGQDAHDAYESGSNAQQTADQNRPPGH